MGFLFVSLFLSVFSVLYLLCVIAVIVFVFVKFVLYVFQSFGLLRIAKKEGYRLPCLVWVPAVSQYYLGRYCMSQKLSVGYALLAALSLGLPAAAYLLQFRVLMWTALGYGAVYFVVDMLVMDRFYKKVYKVPELYTVLTILTLGMLKPVFIYMARIKKITKTVL